MRQFGLTIAVIWTLLASVGPALADDDVIAPHDPNDSVEVQKRARPEYDAHGLRVGSFLFYPSLTAGVGYADNVYNAPAATGDYFYTLAPEARLESSWSRHWLQLSAGSKSYWYGQQSNDNRTDWHVNGATRLDLARGSEIKANASYELLHEPFGAELAGGLAPGKPAAPTEYSRSGFGVEVAQAINRVKLSAGIDLNKFDYRDSAVVQPALPPALPPLNNDDRDRTVTEFFGKAAFEVGGDTAVFLRARVDQHKYVQRLDDDLFRRDSNGRSVDGGLEFQLTHVLSGEAYVGYTNRNYADVRFPDTNQFGFGAGLKWFPSMLTTVSVDGGRSIEDTSIFQAASYVLTRGQVSVDHELLRNLILSGRLGFGTSDYVGITRNDDSFDASLGGRYLFDNNLEFDAGWEFTDRSSSVPAFSYSSGQFLFSVTGKM